MLLGRQKWLINILYSVILHQHLPFFLQEIPQQMNGSDCGMFTCKYAEYITKEKPIKFTQVFQSHYFVIYLM